MIVSWILLTYGENISQKGPSSPIIWGHNRMFSAFGLFSAPALLCGDVKEVWWVGLWSIIRFVFNNHPLRSSRMYSTTSGSVFIQPVSQLSSPQSWGCSELLYTLKNVIIIIWCIQMFSTKTSNIQPSTAIPSVRRIWKTSFKIYMIRDIEYRRFVFSLAGPGWLWHLLLTKLEKMK